MTHTESYTLPDVAYGAKDTWQSWSEFVQKPPELQPVAEEQPPEPVAPVTHDDGLQHPAVEQVDMVNASLTEVAVPEPSNLDTFTKSRLDDHQHQLNWERGQVDYLGVDSFENILRQIDSAITEKPRRSASTGSVELQKGKGKVAPRRQASVGPAGQVEPTPEAIIPVKAALISSKVAAAEAGLEQWLLDDFADEEVVQSEREEIVIRSPGRKRESISEEQLESQAVRRPRPRAVRPKPVSPPLVDRVERILRTSGRRQEVMVSEAELAALSAPLCVGCAVPSTENSHLVGVHAAVATGVTLSASKKSESADIQTAQEGDDNKHPSDKSSAAEVHPTQTSVGKGRAATDKGGGSSQSRRKKAGIADSHGSSTRK
jgi:hypothetical protein